MRQGRWTSDTFSLPLRRYATMAPLRLLVVFGVVAVASAYPTSPYWMNGGRSAFAMPQMTMPAVPPQFFPNRALSFTGYFAGSGMPYRGQWAATRQNPYYINEDGSMQVSAMMDDNFESSHGYNMENSPVSMDGSGRVIPGGSGGATWSGSGRVESGAPPQSPPEVSMTTPYPNPEVNTVAGASEEPTPSPTTATSPKEPEPTTTTTAAPPPPPPPVAPAASEPAGASAPPPPPPQPPKRRTGGRSNQAPQHQPFPQDNDNDNYGNPTINAWFPFVFGGSGGGNPNRAFNVADDDSQLTPNSYNSRPQYGRSSGTSGHSPVAIANSFSTGRNAMAHSVATAYGVPPSNTSSQQRN